MLRISITALLAIVHLSLNAEEFSALDFLHSQCAECHDNENPEGGVFIEDLGPPAQENVPLYQRIALQLLSGNMPPDANNTPRRSDSIQAVDWIRDQLAEMDHPLEADYKLRQPAYANLLNHRQLFDRDVAQAAFSRPRMWRIHPEAYDIFLTTFGNQLAKGGPLAKPFLVGDGKGLASNYASLMQADSATANQLILNCRQIAQFQTTGFQKMETDRKTKQEVARIYKKTPEAFQAILDNPTDTSPQQIAAAVTEEFLIVLNREPDATEAAEFAKLLDEAIRIGGAAAGLRTMAMAVLLRPEAIYRMEIGLGPVDELGRRHLSPYELAHALAYALTDTSPDKLLVGPPKPNDRGRRPTQPSLLELAERGDLSTRQDVQRVAQQIWQADYIEKPRVLRFFREFFGYHAAETVFKGDRAGKEFATRFFVKDADMLVEHIVRSDHDVLKQLLTTDQFFVQWPGSIAEYDRRIQYITNRIKPDNPKDRNYKHFIERPKSGINSIPQANPTWRKTVRFYNLNDETWDYPTEQPFPMPKGQRAGLLTHPAWLVAWSGNFENDPIRRGKWIREHLLADVVPEVPITVDASVPEDPHKTLRDRLSVTREAYCWGCHHKMDPLGLPFESYNDFGRFRDREGLGHTRALSKAKHTAPIDTSGAVIASGDVTLDGSVKNVEEMVHRLANSDLVRQSFVRHAFRYWLGRNETHRDAPTLVAADDAYVDSGGSFRRLVIQLLCSDSFLLRK